MAVGAREFVISLKSADNASWIASIFRDPATTPVDNTAAAPTTISSHVAIPNTRGQGFGGPGTDDQHKVSAISGATNATPIVITQADTAASLGIAAGDFVYVNGVLGNLNANGTFEVASVSGSTVTLKGSAGSGAYTSGGYIRKLNKGDLRVTLNAIAVAIANDLSKNG